MSLNSEPLCSRPHTVHTSLGRYQEVLSVISIFVVYRRAVFERPNVTCTILTSRVLRYRFYSPGPSKFGNFVRNCLQFLRCGRRGGGACLQPQRNQGQIKITTNTPKATLPMTGFHFAVMCPPWCCRRLKRGRLGVFRLAILCGFVTILERGRSTSAWLASHRFNIVSFFQDSTTVPPQASSKWFLCLPTRGLFFTVIFCQALLHFCETTEAQSLEMLFREGGDPLSLQTHSNTFAGELIMATMEVRPVK